MTRELNKRFDFLKKTIPHYVNKNMPYDSHRFNSDRWNLLDVQQLLEDLQAECIRLRQRNVALRDTLKLKVIRLTKGN